MESTRLDGLNGHINLKEDEDLDEAKSLINNPYFESNQTQCFKDLNLFLYKCPNEKSFDMEIDRDECINKVRFSF